MKDHFQLIRYSSQRLRLILKVTLAILGILFLWNTISVMIYFNTIVYSSPDAWPAELPNLLNVSVIRLIETLATLLIAVVLIIFIELPGRKVHFNIWFVLLVLLVCFPGSVAVNILSQFIRKTSGHEIPPFDGFFLVRSLQYYVPLSMSLLAYGLTVFYSMVRREREEVLKAEAYAQEAKWQMLRYQVNPHFLFNSLNSIMALINQDRETARRVVNELSNYFRYTLAWKETSVIPLREELNAVRHFLEIQKIRFQDKLQYQFEIASETEEFLIPIFSLQTLVENAVKFGIKTSEKQVSVTVQSNQNSVYNYIRVINSGAMYISDNKGERERAVDGTNSGLVNLRSRLELLYPSESEISLQEEDGYVIAEIKIKKNARPQR